MTQIRKKDIKRKSVYPLVSTAHLPQEEVSVIIPITSLGKNYSIRWYFNNLTNDACVLDFKSKDEQSTLSKVDDKNITNLREKVIESLVNPADPLTEQRREAFRRIMRKDKKVEEIMKVEIGMNSIVNDLVTMVLNSCI